MPVTAAIIGGGAVLGASYLQGRSQESAARRAADDNREAMQNRHQWQVRDLRKAGINPILSASLGGSQGMPGVLAQVPSYAEAVGTAVNTGVTAMQAESQLDRLVQEVSNMKETQNLTKEQVKVAVKQATSLAASADLQFAQGQQVDYQNIRDAIRVKFAQDNDWQLKVKEISENLGVRVSDFLNILNHVTLRGITQGKLNNPSGTARPQ